jgi:hypothetical protein
MRLAIADLETEWPEYPVFHIDLNGSINDALRQIDEKGYLASLPAP